MKPTLPSTETNSRRESCNSRPQRISLPKTDYNFRPPTHGNFGGRCGGDEEQPRFRAISTDYFNGDGRNTFIGEATLFAVLVIIAAVPVLEGARGLLQFVRIVGVL